MQEVFLVKNNIQLILFSVLKYPTIIIPAFSRPRSLKRLLRSVQNGIYPKTKINLIISLDGGSTEDVINVAKNFNFSHGRVDIIEREENIGLKEHILWCGDQTKKYGCVIILEDDLLVDPYFYVYTVKALKYYDSENHIAGIALYSPRYNEHAKLPFEPAQNGTSGYFMQIACSSGQSWTANQWYCFKEWYNKTDGEKIFENQKIPKDVRGWPSSSWKKYFSLYLSINDLFIFYPYRSYSTNCSDSGGEHITAASNNFQVPIGIHNRKIDQEYLFPILDTNPVQYDTYMEPRGRWIEKLVEIDNSKLECDFYGTKPLSLLKKKKFCITSRNSWKPIRSYPLKYRPIVQNLLFSEESGDTEGLVLTESKNLLPTSPDQIRIKLAEYYSYFELGTKEFIRTYKKNILLKNRKKKIFYWFYRKIRYPFKLAKRLMHG